MLAEPSRRMSAERPAHFAKAKVHANLFKDVDQELGTFCQDRLRQHRFGFALQAMISHNVHRAGPGAVADDMEKATRLDSCGQGQ